METNLQGIIYLFEIGNYCVAVFGQTCFRCRFRSKTALCNDHAMQFKAITSNTE